MLCCVLLKTCIHPLLGLLVELLRFFCTVWTQRLLAPQQRPTDLLETQNFECALHRVTVLSLWRVAITLFQQLDGRTFVSN